MDDITRLFDLLPRYEKAFLFKEDAIVGKENGEWVKYSIAGYREAADAISYALLNHGIVKGDKVATIMPGRPEWNFPDMGIMQTGAVHVPVYPTISKSDYKFILSHTGLKFIFAPGKDIYRKLEHILPDIKGLPGVYTIKETEGTRTLQEFIDFGKSKVDINLLEKAKSAIQTNDLATIIYTSGTTGNPRSVMLSHANIISNFKAVSHIPPFGEEGKALIYLLLCHVYERMLNYLYNYPGMSIYYAENMATIGDNMRGIKPKILTTVPRLLEKIYDRIMGTGSKSTGVKRVIFFWAVIMGLRYEMNGANGWYYEQKLKLAIKLVFSRWRAAVGGNMKVIVSGGASLQPRLSRVFWAAGIPVLEVYGFAETSPVIAVNDFGKNGNCFGTVERAIENVEVNIANDGEILCKGPGVMLGYYKEPELTAEAVDSAGWFHTGDVWQK